MNNQFDDLILQKSRNYALDPLLVKAIVAAESNGDPNAYRAEPQIQDASYGLMQVLLATARWMGYAGAGQGLFDPQVNVEFGTRYLKYLRDYFHGDALKMISGYNAGPGGVRQDASGRFSNQAYVDRVYGFWMGYLGQQRAATTSGMTLQPENPQIGPIPTSRQIAAPASPPAPIPSPLDFGSFLDTVWTPETAPWILAGAAALAIAALSSRR